MTTLKFSGSGREYFRIWIVNFALALSTLGIYSAWAKVKRLQYFYRHTTLDGFSFDYTGEPFAILKGRLVAAALFILYSMAGLLGPWATLLSLVALLIVMPWLLARSLRFRLRNTRYRGLRFRFSGSTRTAYWIFAGLPVLSVLSLFTMVPFTHHRIRRYQHGNASFGSTRFTFRGRVGEFYVAWTVVVAVIIGFLLALVGLAVIFALLTMAAGGREPGVRPTVPLWFLGVAVVIYLTAAVAAQAVLQARIQNHVWERTSLGAHAFTCDLEALPLFRLLWANLFGTVLTLGLFRPFAQVRLARYVAGAVHLVPAGSIDELTADDSSEDVGATGQEAADFFDFDIAF